MANQNIDISVVIPAYNEADFLPACLQSLQQQCFFGTYEVIVVDNNSSDNTADVAKAHDVRVVRELRQGVCYARQSGAQAARGNIIVTTDADCVFPTDWLQRHFQAFLQNPSAAAVCGRFEFTPVPRWGKWYSVLLFKLVRYRYQKTGNILYAGAANIAYTKKVWNAIGGYNTSLHQGGDEYDLLRRIGKQGPVIYTHENKVITSSRRLKKGLLYSLFVTAFLYYGVDYVVATKLTGRSVFGGYPAFREPVQKTGPFMDFVKTFSFVAVVGCLVLLSFSPRTFIVHEAQAKSIAVSRGKKVSATLHRLHSHIARVSWKGMP